MHCDSSKEIQAVVCEQSPLRFHSEGRELLAKKELNNEKIV
jgi:hypothetical protein